MSEKHSESEFSADIERMFEFSASGISKKYNQNKKDVLKAIKICANIDKASVNPSYSLPNLFEYPFKLRNSAYILEFIKSHGAKRYNDTLRTIARFGNIYTPLYSVENLSSLLYDFLNHLENNQSSMSKYGYPSTLFKKSLWLETQLNRLYITRRCNVEVGPNIIKYSWLRRLKTRRIYKSCEYGSAAAVNGLDNDHIQRIESAREKLNILKMEILGFLVRSLDQGSFIKLWTDCMGMLKNSLDKTEAKFFLRLDSRYQDNWISPFGSLPILDVPNSGGINDFLGILGFIEKELRIETDTLFLENYSAYVKKVNDFTEYGYSPYLNQDRKSNNKVQLPNKLDYMGFLDEIIFGSESKFRHFTDFIVRKIRQEHRFWEEFDNRCRNEILMWLGKADKFGNLIIPPSTSSLKLDQKLRLFLFPGIVEFGGITYKLPEWQFWAFYFIMKSHLDGISTVPKDSIYEFAEAPENVRKYSIVKWFKMSKGASRKLIENGLLKTGGSKTCYIPLPIHRLDIVEPPESY